MFLLFYAATNGLGALKLILSPGEVITRCATRCRLFFAKWFHVCFLLLQNDTVDKNAVWNLRSRIQFRSNQHEKRLVTYLCNEMSLFCYIARFFCCRRHSLSFTLQLIWGNVVSVNVVEGDFTLSYVPRIVLTKPNNYIIPFFIIWRL